MRTLPKKTRKILFSKKEYEFMRDYFVQCTRDAFAGTNDYTSVNHVREFFYQWHLVDLIKKFSKSRESDIAFVHLTPPELKTAQSMFQRVDCNEQMRTIQRRFFIQL